MRFKSADKMERNEQFEAPSSPDEEMLKNGKKKGKSLLLPLSTVSVAARSKSDSTVPYTSPPSSSSTSGPRSPRRFINVSNFKTLSPKTKSSLHTLTGGVKSIKVSAPPLLSSVFGLSSCKIQEMEAICARLRSQQQQQRQNSGGNSPPLTKISFGFEKNTVIPKSDINILCNTLKNGNNCSEIKSIAIGSGVVQEAHALILDGISQNFSELQTLHLNLGATIISEKTLLKLQQCANLKRLIVEDSWVATGDGFDDSNHFNFIKLVPLLPNLKSLELINCGLQNSHVIDMYKSLIKNKDSISSLEELSLCKNPRLTAPAFALLMNLPETIRKIDISHCGITSESLPSMAQIIKEKTYVKELDISYNPIGTADNNAPLFDFLKGCFSTMESLNLSFCGIEHKAQIAFVANLFQRKDDCTMQYLAMQGKSTTLMESKANDIWKQNNTLRALVLSNPSSPMEPLVLLRKKKK